MAGAIVVIHSAGWLEGGLTVSYEKLITDVEVPQVMAEICIADDATSNDMSMDEILDVCPGGHFFGTDHTLARYQTEFYSAIVSDYANYGASKERGGADSTSQAKNVWQEILSSPSEISFSSKAAGNLKDYIIKKTEGGGAAPVS